MTAGEQLIDTNVLVHAYVHLEARKWRRSGVAGGEAVELWRGKGRPVERPMKQGMV